MAAPQENRTATLAFVALIGLSALGAVAVLMRGSTGPGGKPAAPVKRSNAWLDTAPPQVQDTSMIAQEPDRSSMDLVGRPQEMAPPSSNPKPAASAPAPTPTKEAESEGGPTKGLSAGEKDTLNEKAGRDMTLPKEADAVGKSDGLWSKLLKGLAGHPRIMAYLINNDTVVDAFMSRPASKQNCRSASGFTSYLSDTKRPNGVTHAMNIVETVLHGHPDMPTVIFGSKLADAIQKCPSTQSIVKDKAAIGAIAQSNPRMLGLMLDPALMKGLATSPAAMASFESVQNNLAQ